MLKECSFLSPQRMGNIRPIPCPDFRVWFKGTIPWFQGLVWRNHILKSGYHNLKSGYGNGLQILEITVMWPFLIRLIIRIYHFEVKIIDTASRFLWPRSKILSQSPQKIALKYWTQQFGGCRLVGFSRSPPQNFPSLLALREYFQNFHTSSQIHITDYFVNCHFQAVLCYLIYRNLWRRYLFSLLNCFKFEEKIFAAFFFDNL